MSLARVQDCQRPNQLELINITTAALAERFHAQNRSANWHLSISLTIPLPANKDNLNGVNWYLTFVMRIIIVIIIIYGIS